MSAPPDAERLDALDGLRGVAVAGVLAFHAGLLGGGFLGVSTFFTLSGFLIGRLLLDEAEVTGFIDLRRFWARRARRLVPASLVCAVGVLLFAATAGSPSQLRSLRADMLAALGQVANWRFLALGQGYANRFADPSPLQHYWSLAIEEQFYLTLPIVMWWLARRRAGYTRKAWLLRRRVRVLGGALTGVVAGTLIGALVSPQHGYYDTFTRLPELLVGVALAAWVGRRGDVRFDVPAVRVLSRSAPLAIAVGVALWWQAAPSQRWLGRGGFLANALATAVLVIACHDTGRTAAVLAWRPLAWLGRVSYGVYLYHWPVFLWLSPARTGLHGTLLLAVRVAATLALAQLSWTWLEHPVRRRVVPRGATARYAAVVAGVLVAANLFLVTARPPQAAVAFPSARGEVLDAAERVRPSTAPAATSEATTPATSALAPGVPGTAPTTTTTTAAPRPPLRVMVVGDSIGLTLAGGMIEYARSHPGWRIYVDAESGCSLATGGRLRALGYDAEDPPKCADRNAAIAAHVQEFKPDVVLVLSCLWEVADRMLPDGRKWLQPGDAAYDAFARRAVAATADAVTATGAAVGWMTCPHLDPDYHPEYYMGPPPYPVAEPQRVAAYNTLVVDELAGRPVTMVDLAGYLSALPGGDLDRTRRPDGVHLSKPIAGEVGAWAVAKLVPAS